jgi:hypothetical protein
MLKNLFKKEFYLNIDNFQKRKQNPTQLRITGQQLVLEQYIYILFRTTPLQRGRLPPG